jgi:hypothetical protein
MFALGVWLFFSPFWMTSYGSLTSVPTWNSCIFGALVAIFALGALAEEKRWEEWLNAVIGLWLVLSPFVLGFHEAGAAAWNPIVVGILIGLDAMMVLLQRPTGTGLGHGAH